MAPEASWDESLARLEDVLLSLPYGRALPDLSEIIDRAGVTEDYLRADERATKVLHEAIVARPLGSIDEVSKLKVEVELLTLEVEVLTSRLHSDAATLAEVDRAVERLATVRCRLAELREQL